MAGAPSNDLDVAIIGAGISGAYCAYRLSLARPDLRIAMFERSERVGGRLMSVDVGASTKAELGGGFVSSLHRNVVGLAKEAQLALTPIRWERRGLLLRGWRGSDETIAGAAAVYDLAEGERDKSPYALLANALRKIAPGYDALWPMAADADPRSARAALESMTYGGCSLRDWAFRDLLREVLSAEAHELIANTIGSSANVGPYSALEMVRTLQFEFAPQRAFIVEEGYAKMVQRLLEASGATLHTGCELLGLNAAPDGVTLHFSDREMRAARVILALPRAAIAEMAGAERVRQDLAHVADVAAFKLFMVFREAWWPAVKSAKAGRGVAASYTDLPMQQCYLGDTAPGEAALCLAAFADAENAAFWASEQAPQQEALRQLRALHPDIDIPAPEKTLMQMWPAAWHAWRPGTDGRAIAARLRAGAPAFPVHICGESFSALQGWAEGAVNSAEMLMQESFGLDRAAWIDVEYPLDQ